MSSDVFIMSSKRFNLETIVSSYRSIGAQVTGDLQYLAVQGKFGRFYLVEDTSDSEVGTWKLFEDDEKAKVVEIVGEVNWILTVIHGTFNEVNTAIEHFPVVENAAVDNDNGLVLSLDAARQLASSDQHWSRLKRI